MTHADVCPDPRLHWPDGVCRGEVWHQTRIEDGTADLVTGCRVRDQWKCKVCEDVIVTNESFEVVKVIPLGCAPIEARR